VSPIRPRPPAHLSAVDGQLAGPIFEPAPALVDWMRDGFILEVAVLANPDHGHLASANIGALWTNVPNSRGGRTIVGQAEFKPPGSTMGKWARARAESQIIGWFGELPDFMLTFDAGYAAACSDAEFCALAEHELYHCGQARDEFGAPRFRKSSGLPVFELRAHDVEEFIGVVKRYCADAAHVEALVLAAAQTADVPAGRIAGACGTCAA
jgi:hypothetical protein